MALWVQSTGAGRSGQGRVVKVNGEGHASSGVVDREHWGTSLHYLVKHECVVYVQLTGAGRSGQHGTSAAVRAVTVKGQGQGQGHMSVLCRYTTL